MAWVGKFVCYRFKEGKKGLKKLTQSGKAGFLGNPVILPGSVEYLSMFRVVNVCIASLPVG